MTDDQPSPVEKLLRNAFAPNPPPEAEDRDTKILAELRGHLKCAHEWAHPDNLAPPGEWSCVSSTLEAVNQGNLGLALTRWGDLSYSDNMPLLSPEAENWKKS